MATKEYKLGYSRGYIAGRRNAWPPHYPPTPPHDKVAALFLSSQELADAAFDVLAVIISDEEIFLKLQEKAHSVDNSFENIKEWLSNEQVVATWSIKNPPPG